MTSGRRPKPTAVKIAEGTTRDVNYDEPKPEDGRPMPPDYLDAMAKNEWHRLCDLLQSMGVLTMADAPMLEIYSVCYSKYRDVLKAVNKTGPVLVQKHAKKTEISRNPFSVELHKYMATMNKMLVEFGLTPAARSTFVQNKNDAVKRRKRV